ncbi:MAG: hypothetical protein R6U43_11005 [Candidatus Krumholzibacteriales bacterium]
MKKTVNTIVLLFVLFSLSIVIPEGISARRNIACADPSEDPHLSADTGDTCLATNVDENMISKRSFMFRIILEQAVRLVF